MYMPDYPAITKSETVEVLPVGALARAGTRGSAPYGCHINKDHGILPYYKMFFCIFFTVALLIVTGKSGA